MGKTTGGRIIAEMLEAEGVEKLFGIVDGTYLQLFSSCVQLGMTLFTPRHESIAMHMAGAYARLSGKLGVCLASNGPGVANVLPGVAVENGEGNRVLLLTSCRRPQIAYPDRGGAYQTFDQVGVIGAMSKWSQTVKSVDRLPELLRAALRACYQGRPGVVHLDIPETIINSPCEQPSLPAPQQYRRMDPITPPKSTVSRAAQLLTTAKLPLIHCGSGVIHAQAFDLVEQLAELLHAPVTTSWAGRGVVPERSPLAWPMVHVSAVNEVRGAADVVLCLGSDMGETDWWGKMPYWGDPKKQRFIQVDIDEARLGRNHVVELGVLADVKAFLVELIPELQHSKATMPLSARRDAVAPLAAKRDEDRAKLDEALEDRSTPMLTAHVGAICREVFDDDAVVVFDGGNTAVWGNFYTELRTPNSQLGTHHFGHLGAGLGQALGAAVARPEKQVYCIIGDGAMGFHPQEVETAVRNGLKVVFLVCCDQQWGMVKLTQRLKLAPAKTLVKKALGPKGEPLDIPLIKGGQLDELAQQALAPLKEALGKQLAGEPSINADLGEIQFDKLAEAMGAHGERVSSPDDLKPALDRALAANRCAVIHVDVNNEKHLWAPGLLHFKDMHQEPKGK